MLQPALFQSRDRCAHHAVAEVSLRNAEQLRAAPFLVDCLNICEAHDEIKIAPDKKHAIRAAQWLVVHR